MTDSNTMLDRALRELADGAYVVMMTADIPTSGTEIEAAAIPAAVVSE